MNLLGANVPISGWTVAVTVCGVALSLRYGRRLARTLGWHPDTTVAALLSLTALLALTVTPDGDRPPVPLRRCVPLDPGRLAYNALHTGGGLSADLLNGLLPLPLALTLTLASGRPGRVLALVLLLPGGIELAQTVLPGRYCSITDYLANCVGGLVGVALGVLARSRLVTGSNPQ